MHMQPPANCLLIDCFFRSLSLLFLFSLIFSLCLKVFVIVWYNFESVMLMVSAYTNIVLMLHMMYKYEDVFRKSDTFTYVVCKSSGWVENRKFSSWSAAGALKLYILYTCVFICIHDCTHTTVLYSALQVSHAHQGCIYLIKNTVKAVILWNIITI